MQGIRDRGWTVFCGQEVDLGDAWVESRRKRASAKQPEEIIRKDKRKKTADATEIPDGRGRTWSCIQGKWCGAERIWKLHNGKQKTDQGESSFRGGTSLRQLPARGRLSQLRPAGDRRICPAAAFVSSVWLLSVVLMPSSDSGSIAGGPAVSAKYA